MNRKSEDALYKACRWTIGNPGYREPGIPGSRDTGTPMGYRWYTDGIPKLLYKGKTQHSPPTTNKMIEMNFF